jgi:argininosuccinate lyase
MSDKPEKSSDSAKPWGGRFSESTDALVEEFTGSVSFDQRLFEHDIEGSLAHAEMLTRAGILTSEEFDKLSEGLASVRQEIRDGKFQWKLELEDVHMNIEARLTELVGDVGKKLHTGRSRNDQVATDIRLYLRDHLDAIGGEITALQTALLELATGHTETVMPGFTHMQTAQPVSFAHHLMAWYAMLDRDYSRFADCRKRLNQSPLGAAALAGTPHPIDRELTASLLGFDRPMGNSLDAVSDRDFAIEFSSCAALLMTHLSRMSEELVLWACARFEFIELPDSFCTGSSIMPQKKNPDVPELVRGKTGRVTGNLVSLLTLMKSQPLAYNKDNQEDKEPLFDTIDTLHMCLQVFAAMVPTIKANAGAMRQAAIEGYSTATDLADYLVKKNIPFRDAHEVVGKTVAFAIEQGKDLSELELVQLQQFSDDIQDDVFDVLTLEGSLASRDHIGGTAPKQVSRAIEAASKDLSKRT